MGGKAVQNPRDLWRPGKIPDAILRDALPPIPEHFQLVVVILPVVVDGFGPHPEDGFVIHAMSQRLAIRGRFPTMPLNPSTRPKTP